MPHGYLAGVEALCKKYNVLLILDEVATGFGRTGKMFACEHEDVTPDIMIIGKGITGGYLPIAATLSTEQIYEAFYDDYTNMKTLFHGHSYTGMPEITLKYGLSNLIQYSPADEMNRRENTIIAIVMKLIAEDERGYTSAKYLSEHITDLGFKKTKQSILPYIELAKSLGILEPTENSLKPYRIVKSKEEITVLVKDYLPDTSDI